MKSLFVMALAAFCFVFLTVQANQPGPIVAGGKTGNDGGEGYVRSCTFGCKGSGSCSQCNEGSVPH